MTTYSSFQFVDYGMTIAIKGTSIKEGDNGHIKTIEEAQQ
jgi:hypothetical protein